MFCSNSSLRLKAMAALALAAMPLSAGAQTFSFSAWAQGLLDSPTSVNGITIDYFVTQNSDNANTSTHILLTGLTPVGTSARVLEGEYVGVVLSSGAELDTGKIVLTLPADLTVPAGGVSSPIVGIVPRSGTWTGSASSNPLNNASANVVYDDDASFGTTNPRSITLKLKKDGKTYTGTTTYTATSESSLDLAAFTLTDGTTSWNMAASTFSLSYGELSGFISLADAGNTSDLAVTRVVMNAFPDVDTDMIPDLMDSNVGDPVLVLNGGTWEYNGSNFGWYYNYPASSWIFVKGAAIGNLYAENYPWVYHPSWGWLYMTQRRTWDGRVVIWMAGANSWITTNINENFEDSKWFYVFGSDQWGIWTEPNLQGNSSNGKPFFTVGDLQ